jgi:hypothetical protein
LSRTWWSADLRQDLALADEVEAQYKATPWHRTRHWNASSPCSSCASSSSFGHQADSARAGSGPARSPHSSQRESALSV